MTGINSALNPIIYMFRSNEFRIAFKRLFRGTSIVPKPTEGKDKARAGLSRLDVSTCDQHGRLPSFLTVPTENEKVLSSRIPSSEISVEVIEESPALIRSESSCDYEIIWSVGLSGVRTRSREC